MTQSPVKPCLNGRRSGVTLIELLIAIMLIGTGILVSILSFGGISKSIQTSKGRTLATNIAQEKMQIIMQKSYYEVLVTTSPSFLVFASTTIVYDNIYFKPETVPEGGMTFTRYTYVQPIMEDSGQITALPSNTQDTGMRKITVTVVWATDSGNRMINLQSVINNPNTVMANSYLQGVVYDSSTHTPIVNAIVDAAENIGWRDTSNASGQYSIALSPGVFNFQASAAGYYSSIVPLPCAANSTTAYSFYLQPISTGTITGIAWVNKHIVVSQVVGSTGSANSLEYVELYNPTTSSYLIGSNTTTNNPNVWPIIWDYTNVGSPRHLYYTAAGNSVIPANGYYLITNTGNSDPATACASITIGGVTKTPDACWLHVISPSLGIECAAAPCPTGGNPWNGSSADAGAVSLGNAVSVIGSNVDMTNWPANRIDTVGWAQSAVGHPAPSNGVETTALQAIFGGGVGLPIGEQFVRKMSTGTISGAFGRAYDANINNLDFAEIGGISVNPSNSSNVVAPLTGTPATGAIVSVIDGISSPSSTTLVGSPPFAQFTVPKVATGTWIVFIDSGSSSAEIDNVSVLANSTVSVPNATSFPTGTGNIVLSTSGVVGMISGRVTNTVNSPIAGGILVTAGGASMTTNSNGLYFLRVATGTYNVVANPGNANSLYASGALPPITINIGDVAYNSDFQLPQGGQISGWISRDGLNPLPGVAVTAFDGNGIPQDTEVSGSNGQFLLVNLTTGVYTVTPALDLKETSSPNSATSIPVTAGNTTFSSSFTILGAMGTVKGKVTYSGDPIKSGVLIVASTASISTPLPILNLGTLTRAAIYGDSSQEDGNYALDVRGSTTATYNLSAFYTTVNGTTFTTSTRTVSGISVNAGAATTGVNFAW